MDLTTLDQAGQEAELNGAWSALNNNGITTGKYVAYPSGKYNAATPAAMTSQNMYTGRTLVTFNNVSPLSSSFTNQLSPFEIGQRSISRNTSLATAQGWVTTAIARQEIFWNHHPGPQRQPELERLVYFTLPEPDGLLHSAGYPHHHYDLYQLQNGDITIPEAQ